MTDIDPDLEAEILSFFNEAKSADEICQGIQDRGEAGGYGIRLELAARILKEREQLEGGRFTSLQQIDDVGGVGPDTLKDIIESFRPGPVPPINLIRSIIIGINWPHGGEISLDELKNPPDDDPPGMGAQLVVRFSHRLNEPKGEVNGINPRTFTVAYLTQTGTLEYIMPPDPEDLEEGEAATPRLSTDRRCAIFDIPQDLLGGRGSIANSTVFVTLRCDFLLDDQGHAVSGAHIGGDIVRRGSGNNVEGGLFESWFYVTPPKKRQQE